jgi:hypothetical protein
VKLQQALEIGDTCGLTTPPECVNYVILHWMNLFSYEEAEAQVEELLKEAAVAGIKFCVSCGSAMNSAGVCYMASLTHRDPM